MAGKKVKIINFVKTIFQQIISDMYIIDSSKTPKPSETVGEYLRRLRESANISQQDLAEAAGIHLSVMYQFE
ncbi:MAG: helix-turn-helix transcriptional regulator [Okeania sp. SIO3H1]|nr:helix-turn-helix transcriptional regulator [Okeania sp. SIO3H1]